MARQIAVGEFTNFIQGLITEASPLAFPENASLDEENFVLKRDGSRQRRLGLDYESGYVTTTTGVSNGKVISGIAPVSVYRWDNVGNDSSLSLGVVQIGFELYLVDLGASTPSASLKNGGGPITLSSVSFERRASYTPIGGELFVATGDRAITQISYDAVTDTASSSEFVPLVRDLWGDDDSAVGTEPDIRPTTDVLEHRYNTFNQGWYRDDVYCKGTGAANPYDHMFATLGEYPSNSDIWWVSRDSQSGGADFDSFDPNRFSYVSGGNTEAPRGHYVINPFLRSSSRSDQSGISTGSSDYDLGGFWAISSFAGRVFYSGVTITDSVHIPTSPKLETAVFFSQVVRDGSHLSKCYQEQDPTAEDGGDLVETDGGVIYIPEASSILGLVPAGSQLFVFAENGVWSIRGSEQGFSATNYQVDRISNVGALSSSSIVDAEGSVFFWASSGVYLLSLDKVTSTYVAKNITERTINTLYLEDIPSTGKLYATGAFDAASRGVRWLYNDEAGYDGNTNLFRFNKELVFDLTTAAWSKYSFPAAASGPFLAAPIVTPDFVSATTTDNVVDGADNVVDGTDNVVITNEVRGRGTTSMKYLTLIAGVSDIGFTISHYRRDDYLDWYTVDSTGTDAAAFLETGYITGGTTEREKMINSLTAHFKRTETGYELDGNGNVTLTNPSGCQARVKWGFTDSSNSGKWSTPFQAYRLRRLYLPEDVNDPFDYGFDIISTRNKIRGQGRSLRVRFESEAGKDLFIHGWALTFSVEKNN